jgi:peptidoglycan/xylan/chitin deacetylase (PgdA/CDA1 family)
MIGVIYAGKKYPVEETFQLLKVPWEFYRAGQKYDVVITDSVFHGKCDAVIISTPQALVSDRKAGFSLDKAESKKTAGGVPIYTEAHAVSGRATALLRDGGGKPVCVKRGKRIRIGFDIFAEIAHVLNKGQPEENSKIPSADAHLGFLRNLLRNETTLVEIPPVPYGHSYFVAMTHDVDHMSLKEHYRSTLDGLFLRKVGSLFGKSTLNLAKGSSGGKETLESFKAGVQTVLSKASLSKDPWDCFGDWIEMGREFGFRSTFFFIPMKSAAPEGKACLPCDYNILEKGKLVHAIIGAGSEIGVHGLSAWCDEDKAVEELARLQRVSKQERIGIRMHWLLFGPDTWKILDKAGYYYDSTFGYGEDSGFRAGTTQVYRPEGVRELLEIPLHVHDTSFFLQEGMTAEKACHASYAIAKNALKYGGVITLLWHQRTLAGDHYVMGETLRKLLPLLTKDGAKITKAGGIVDWFAARRGIAFDKVQRSKKEIVVTMKSMPARRDFVIRLHVPPSKVESASGVFIKGEGHIDLRLDSPTIRVKLK